MFASIDMTEGNRVRRKSNQFAFPTAKGEVEPLRRYSGGEELMLQRSSGPNSRKSPIMAVSDDYYSHIAYASRPEDSVEMSMKTIEMLALIKGTSPEQLHLQAEMVRRQASEDGQTSTEGSSAHHPSSSSEEFELEFDDDYLLGDSFIGYTEDGNLGDSLDEELISIERGIRNAHIHPSHAATVDVEDEEEAADSHNSAEDEPDDEIFDFEL